MAIVLGNKIRDRVTGFAGIATSRHETLDGNIRYGVTPESDNPGKHPDTICIDEISLELVDAGIANLVIPLSITDIGLGQVVRDSVTGVKGTTVERIESLNGCVHFKVVTSANDTPEKANGTYSLTHQRLRYVEDNGDLSANIRRLRGLRNAAVAADPTTAPPERTGGPSSRMDSLYD